MSDVSTIPLSSILHWAREREMIEAVVVGRTVDGKLVIGSTSGQREAVAALIGEAAADVAAFPVKATKPCDLDRADDVRQSHENEAGSHGGQS